MRAVLILVLLMFLSSCGKSFESSYTFLIRNPYGCTHVFKIKDHGGIDYSVGSDKNYIEEFKGFDIKYNEVSLVKENKEIYKQIESITKDLVKVESKFSKDAFHYQLYKNNKLISDSYSFDYEVNNKIKALIINGIKPIEIDVFCESY